MKNALLLAALGAVPSALAHTVVTNVYANGVTPGDGTAIRMPKDGKSASNPLEDLESKDMACNVDGTKGVPRVLPVPDGAALTFEIRSWPNDPTKERLDRGHKGPCAVYLKKVDSAIDDEAAGQGWFKLFGDGYEKSTDQWCTDKIIDNNGLLSVVLPKGLQGGYYLARPEILALHAANNNDPQFYTGCAQIFLESTGDLAPEETVSIPGYVKKGEESTSFDIYNRDNSEYTLPGPPVAKLSSGASLASADVEKTQTEGLRPEGCIAENGNWCGKEVSSYSDEAGCWKSGEECWAQLDTCYDEAPVTGSKGCETWQSKCQALNDACKAKNFNGPPNKGKDLSPKHDKIDVGVILGSQAADVSEAKPTAEAKSSAPAAPKSTPAVTSAAAAKPTPVYGGEEEAVIPADKPASTPKHTTITVPAPEAAPAPTKDACPEGFECVTIYTTAVETVVEYKTVYADMKRRSLHNRRHGQAF